VKFFQYHYVSHAPAGVVAQHHRTSNEKRMAISRFVMEIDNFN
jgi:hypothetical protein